MGRRPANILAALPKPAGQDAVWAEIRRQGAFTLPSLRGGLTGATARDTIRAYLNRLEAAGIIERTGQEPPPRNTVLWRLIAERDCEETPRVRPDGTVVLQGAARAAMWRTMRILKSFTADDLVRLGSVEEVAIGREDARYYLKMLVHAGYVVVTDRPARTATATTYRLLPTKATGPKAPQVQRQHRVWDPNLERVVWTGAAEAVS